MAGTISPLSNASFVARLTAAITTLVGLLAAILALFKNSEAVSEKLSQITGVPPAWVVPAIVLLLLFAAAALVHWSRRRSILADPDALRLKRGNPDHLVGREREIETLAQRCRGEPLLFLVGESGSGKSALLQSGLVPALREDARLWPVYIESLVGSDWEREPEHFVLAAARRQLAGAEGLPPAADTDSAPANLEELLVRCGRSTGRTPLLIFDQFDDYQIRHQAHFIHDFTWLPPEQLVARNRFWAAMARLLERGQAHLLFTTRKDSATGLESVRFRDARTFLLDRLPGAKIEEILNRLIPAGTEAVLHPDCGWTRLQKRIQSDLSRDGSILPQKLKIVLRGLARQNQELTIAAYERAGGAAGLGANFIAEEVASVHRLCGLPEEAVRWTLEALVLPGSDDKTQTRDTAELTRLLGAPDAAARALDLLEEAEVIRQREPTAAGQIVWSLDHDYLASAVKAADYRANRWRRRLEEGEAARIEAGRHVARWWRSMLPATTQLRFWWDRLRGRFRYGPYRRFAALSAVRFSPLAVVLLVVGLALQEVRTAREAERILAGLDSQQRIEELEVDVLHDLQASSRSVKREILKRILTQSEYGIRFVNHREEVMRAMTGTSPKMRRWVAKTASGYRGKPPTDSKQDRLRALTMSNIVIGVDGDIDLPGEWLLSAARAWRPQGDKEVGQNPFVPALLRIADRSPAKRAIPLIDMASSMVASNIALEDEYLRIDGDWPLLTNPDYAGLLARKLTGPCSAAVVRDLADEGKAIKTASRCAQFAERLPRPAAAHLVKALIAAIDSARLPPLDRAKAVRRIYSAAPSLALSISAQEVRLLDAALMAALDSGATDDGFAGMVALVSPRLDEGTRVRLARSLRSRIGNDFGYPNQSLVEALISLAPGLPPAEAEALVRWLVADMSATQDSQELAHQALALEALAQRLPSAAAAEIAPAFAGLFEGLKISIPASHALDKALFALTDRLPGAAAADVLRPRANRLKRGLAELPRWTGDYFLLVSSAAGYAERLPQGDRPSLVAAVIDLLRRKEKPTRNQPYVNVEPFAETLAALIRADPSIKPRLHQSFLELLGSTQNNYLIPALLQGTVITADEDDVLRHAFGLLTIPEMAGRERKLLELIEGHPAVQARFGGNVWQAAAWLEARQRAGKHTDIDLDRRDVARTLVPAGQWI